MGWDSRGLEVARRDVCLLTRPQWNRITPYVPVSHGVPRVDEVRVLSGIISVSRSGLPWKEAPKADGPPQTLYHRLGRWSRAGLFHKIFHELSRQHGTKECRMIDAPPLKAPRTAASLLQKGQYPAGWAARKAA